MPFSGHGLYETRLNILFKILDEHFYFPMIFFFFNFKKILLEFLKYLNDEQENRFWNKFWGRVTAVEEEGKEL